MAETANVSTLTLMSLLALARAAAASKCSLVILSFTLNLCGFYSRHCPVNQ